jgi:hypothetical protein
MTEHDAITWCIGHEAKVDFFTTNELGPQVKVVKCMEWVIRDTLSEAVRALNYLLALVKEKEQYDQEMSKKIEHFHTEGVAQ